MPVIVIVADGARPDILVKAIERGIVPALALLREEGGLHTVTSVFPSVTGPAYAPFLMGRYPGPVGMPGLRWYDRERKTCRLPGNSRSYVGAGMRKIDSDIDAAAPTIFELAPSSVGALNVIGRGLPTRNRIGTGWKFVLRTGVTHFRGQVDGWLSIDADMGERFARQVRVEQPDFAFAAFTGVDKTSHSEGHGGPSVDRALAIVDETVATLRGDAERRGAWESTHVWVISDHGHSPVSHHEDLAGLVKQSGFKAIAHPFVYSTSGEVAVMVSGNAMAHIYLDLERRTRPWLAELGGRWATLRDILIARDSVDLMILPVAPGSCQVHGHRRGSANLSWGNGRVTYEPANGDPLGLGAPGEITEDESYETTVGTDYPDSLVQISRLCDSARSGEIILSAARDWDFRAMYEPIPHRSSHGALHREHMLVPLLMNRTAATPPRRTVDVMPSALRALGMPVPEGLDGRSFI